MRSGLQDLAGEVARLRAECGHFQRGLDFLERLSDTRTGLTEAQEGEITRINGVYAWSAKENLERATEDLKNWWHELDGAVRQAQTFLAP